MDNLPDPDVDLILGNDLVRGETESAPVLTVDPTPSDDVREEDKLTFTACVVSSYTSRVEESWL